MAALPAAGPRRLRRAPARASRFPGRSRKNTASEVSLSAGAAPSGSEILLYLVADDGTPVEGAELRVDGTFSRHDHSDHTKPTSPQRVSTRARELGEGRYILEGLEAADGGEGAFEVSATLSDGGAIQRAFVIPLPGSNTAGEGHP